MVFDTTSANTGHKTASCISIQIVLDRALLWLACRHHIGEVVLTHVWDELKIECSKSPEISIFRRFRDNFGRLPLIEINNLSHTITLSVSHKSEIIQTIRDAVEHNNSQIFLRGDYLELVELCIFYLEPETFTELFNREFSIKKPGALHKARWMAKILYGIKILLLSQVIMKELPKGAVFGKGQLEKLQHFIRFVFYVYIQWWITAPMVAAAPLHDIVLLKKIENYKSSNQIVSKGALVGIKNHLWYLTEELVPLALFSEEVNNEEKQAMVIKLLEYKEGKFKKRFGSGFGKPCFPTLEGKDLKTISLKDFVGQDSWQFFRILKIDTSFLYQPAERWGNYPLYKTGQMVVNSLKVVNDCAERGVRLGLDFLSSARIEERYQEVLQIVENDRKIMPNQRKRKLEPSNKTWFLALSK